MKNFFKGISFTQVLAGSLAAVTSFLLASKIGIAGSVIGVAVGSIVSAVASQLYQNVIHASSRKLAEANANNVAERTASSDTVDLRNNADAVNNAANNIANNIANNADNAQTSSQSTGDGIHMPYSSDVSPWQDDPSEDGNNLFIPREQYDSSAQSTQAMQPTQPEQLTQPTQPFDAIAGRTVSSQVRNPELENTRILELSALRKQREEDMALSEGSLAEPIPLSQAIRSNYNAVPPEPARHTGSRHATIIIAVLSALLAVVVTACVVLLFTQGKGTDNMNQQEQAPQQQQQPQPQQRNNQNMRVEHKKPVENDTTTQEPTDEDNGKNLHSHENVDSTVNGHTDNESGADTNNNSSSSNSGDGFGGNSSGSDTSTAGAGANAGAGSGSSSGSGSSTSTTAPGSGQVSGGANSNS